MYGQGPEVSTAQWYRNVQVSIRVPPGGTPDDTMPILLVGTGAGDGAFFVALGTEAIKAQLRLMRHGASRVDILAREVYSGGADRGMMVLEVRDAATGTAAPTPIPREPVTEVAPYEPGRAAPVLEPENGLWRTMPVVKPKAPEVVRAPSITPTMVHPQPAVSTAPPAGAGIPWWLIAAAAAAVLLRR